MPVDLDEADPVDCAGWIAKGVDELAVLLVLQRHDLWMKRSLRFRLAR